MPLYTREMYDEDSLALEREAAKITAAVATGKMGGFEANKFWADLEKLQQHLKGKLAFTRLILAEGDAKRKKKQQQTPAHYNALKTNLSNLAHTRNARLAENKGYSNKKI